jgi:hypothetical protein
MPPHASNKFQVLDLSIAAVTKRLIRRVGRAEAVNIQSSDIKEIICPSMSAPNRNICSEFSKRWHFPYSRRHEDSDLSHQARNSEASP